MLGALDCGEEGALDCGDAGAGAGASESESDVDVVEEDEDVDVSDGAFSAFPSVFCFFGAGRGGCSASLSLIWITLAPAKGIHRPVPVAAMQAKVPKSHCAVHDNPAGVRLGVPISC